MKTIQEGVRVSVAGRPGTITDVFEGDSIAVVFDDDETTVMIVQLDDPTLEFLD